MIFFYIFKFTHLKLTKNRIVSLVFRFFSLPLSFHSTMNSIDRAFVIAIIDCVSFIVKCPVEADPTRRQSQTNADEDVVAHVDREHS